ncbi:hypothetical protein ACFPJ1_35385 [Kribbella qitaiheensis]|uniref:hypothetical protein n=1 Tax=Kribbella qitaiheensis TaxID=1544730 RepID=UPI00361B3626
MSVGLTTDRLDLVALDLARDLGELHAMFAEFSLRLSEGHLLTTLVRHFPIGP